MCLISLLQALATIHIGKTVGHMDVVETVIGDGIHGVTAIGRIHALGDGTDKANKANKANK